MSVRPTSRSEVPSVLPGGGLLRARGVCGERRSEGGEGRGGGDMKEMETVDPTDSHSYHGSSSYDDGESSEDLEDVQMYLPSEEEELNDANGAGLKCVVPSLVLANLGPRNGEGLGTQPGSNQAVSVSHSQQVTAAGLGAGGQQTGASPPVVPVSVRSSEVGNTSIAVDLLSNAFRLKHETVQQAREWGCTLEQVVGTGFSSALDISQRNLHYYVVQEVEWDDIAETCPQHIAVGIEGSSFTLGAVEDMLRKNRESQQIITQKIENIRGYENDLQHLRKELKNKTDALHTSESENKQLKRQLEALSLRQAFSQHNQMPSLLSASLVSPRLMSSGGGGNQLRSPSAMARLRDLIAENQQLVSTLERLSGQDMWSEHPQDGTPGVAHRLDMPAGSA